MFINLGIVIDPLKVTFAKEVLTGESVLLSNVARVSFLELVKVASTEVFSIQLG